MASPAIKSLQGRSSGFVLSSLGRLLFAAALLCPTLLQAQAPEERPGGFWKCRSTSTVQGEYESEDPVGLAGRAHIKTDCVFNTTFDKKTYCFASMPSLMEFSDHPADIVAQADLFWSQSSGGH